MTDMSLVIKAAVVTSLASAAGITAIMPSSSVYAMAPPVAPPLPFIRYGKPVVSPFEDSCGGGCEVKGVIHVFSNDENEAHRIAAAVAAEFQSMSASFRLLTCDWDGTEIVAQDEDTWHALVRFSITATE